MPGRAGPHPPSWDQRERDQISAPRFRKDCRDPFHREEDRGWERACHVARATFVPVAGLSRLQASFLALGPTSWRRCSGIPCLHSSVPFLGPHCTFLIEVKGTGKCSASPAEALPSDHKHHDPEILLIRGETQSQAFS